MNSTELTIQNLDKRWESSGHFLTPAEQALGWRDRLAIPRNPTPFGNGDELLFRRSEVPGDRASDFRCDEVVKLIGSPPKATRDHWGLSMNRGGFCKPMDVAECAGLRTGFIWVLRAGDVNGKSPDFAKYQQSARRAASGDSGPTPPAVIALLHDPVVDPLFGFNCAHTLLRLVASEDSPNTPSLAIGRGGVSVAYRAFLFRHSTTYRVS